MENINFIDVEIYTEKLNDMYARVSEYISAHPRNRVIHKLQDQQHLLAIARHKSRFHADEKHFSEWKKLLDQSEKTVREAIIADVLG